MYSDYNNHKKYNKRRLNMKRFYISLLASLLATSALAFDFTPNWGGGAITTATRTAMKNYSTVGVNKVKITCNTETTGATRPCIVIHNNAVVPIPNGEAVLTLNKSVDFLKFATYTTLTDKTTIHISK